MLFTFSFAIGAVVVIVTFLFRSRETAAADMALKESSETKEVSLWSFMHSAIQNFLGFLKEFFGNNWLMIAGVILTLALHDTVVKRINENLVHFAFPILATSLGAEAFLVENIGYLLRAFPARNVHIKHSHDKWTHVFVHDNCFIRFVVEIADRSNTWPIAFFELSSVATAYIDGKIIDILLGNAEIKTHEKLVIGDVLNRLFPSANFLDNASIHEPRNLATIESIPGKAIQFPDQETIFALSSFKESQHFFKIRPS